METLRYHVVTSVVVVVMATFLTTVNSGTENYSVEIKLYQVNVDEWNSDVEGKFKTLLAREANEYCSSNKKCGVNQGAGHFTAEDYEIESGYPKKDKFYLLVSFKLKLPNTNSEYLRAEHLQKVAAGTRQALRDDTGHSLVYVEETRYELPPNNTLNIAISAAAVAILVGLVITLFVLQRRCGGNEDLKEEVPLEVNDKAKETVA